MNRLRLFLTCGFIFVFVVALNLVVLNVHELRSLWGDESKNFKMANSQEFTHAPWASLVPGFLNFGHQPTLVPHLFSLFSNSDLKLCIEKNQFDDSSGATQNMECARSRHRFIRAIVSFQIVQLAGASVLVFLICQILGFSLLTSVLAVILLITNLNILFFTHSFYSEMTSIFLILAGIYCLQLGIKQNSRLAMSLAGFLLGYSMLARGLAGPFVLGYLALALGGLAVKWYRSQGIPPPDLASKCLLFIVFFIFYIAPVSAQKFGNYIRTGNYMIADNTWRAIELGLIYRSPILGEVSATYFKAGKTPTERQKAAQIRVIDFLKRADWGALLWDHYDMATTNLFRRAYFDTIFRFPKGREFDRAKMRYHNIRILDGVFLIPISRWQTVILVTFGLLGLLTLSCQPAGAPIVLFMVYYLVSFFWFGYVGRYSVPLIPFLCVSSAAMAEWFLKTVIRRNA